MEIAKRYTKQLNAPGDKIPQIAFISRKLKVESGVVITGLIMVSLLLIYLFFGARVFTLVLTVLYPAMKSIQALESGKHTDQQGAWLTYWTIFGIFTLMDEFAGILLNFIPFYYYFKILFYIYLLAPQTNGSEVVYRNIVRPILTSNKERIEQFIQDFQGTVIEASGSAQREVSHQVNNPEILMRTTELSKKGQEQLNSLNENKESIEDNIIE